MSAPRAFPYQHNNGFHESGMSLRDYFAAAALQGLLQRPDTDNYNRYDFAGEAYRQADAMLEARQVQL